MTRVGLIGRHQEHTRVQTEPPTTRERPCEISRSSRQLLRLVAQRFDELVCLACRCDPADSLTQGGAVALGLWHQDDAIADACEPHHHPAQPYLQDLL